MFRPAGRIDLLSAALALLISVSFTSAEEKAQTLKFKDKSSGGEISLTVPAEWKQEKPQSNLRLGQIQIPPAEGDEEPGEIAIFVFPGGGGGVDANLKRWIGEFSAEGREVKLFKGDSEQGPYFLSDITGTYNKRVGPPVAGKTMPMPGSRALGVILQVPDRNSFYLKLTGPEKTVAAAEKAYKASFGAKADEEKPFEMK